MNKPDAGRELRVLIIEDSEDDAMLMEEALREDGFAVHGEIVCGDADVRRALRARQWDVVLSDHNMPGFSSADALRLVGELAPGVPVIIVSGALGEEEAVRVIKAGAHDYVLKQSLARLGSAVANALAAAQSNTMREQAERELKQSHTLLRRLAEHMETVREEERARIARDIHDELGGVLTALKIDISWLRKFTAADNEQVEDKLYSMAELIDGSVRSLRRIITDLRPTILDDLGLVAALEWQLQDFEARTGLVCRYDFPDENIELNPPARAVSVFRAFQEALTNITRHARAKTVEVTFSVADGRLFLRVRDDGRGMDLSMAGPAHGFGILGMRERIGYIGGKLELESQPGEGTCISLEIPLESP